MRFMVLVLVLVVGAASAAFAAVAPSVSGAWSVDGTVYGNTVKYDCTLEQDGEKLTGTAKIEGKDIPLTGSVKESEVTWSLDVDYNGQPLTVVFTGTLGSEKAMSGKIAVAGVEGEFTATKK
jgi:hypothetical protein